MLAPATIHWSADGWRTVDDRATRDTGVGLHYVDLPTASLPAGATVVFTFFWPEANHWEGQDYSITVVQGES